MGIGVSNLGIFTRTGEIIGVPVDLRLVETHRASAEATTTTIEDGSPLTDHIFINPDELTIDIEMANSDQRFIAGPAITLGERARESWLSFKRQLNRRERYTVVTTHERYENMALVGIDGENSAPYVGRLLASLQFQSIDSTQLSITAVPESNLSADVAKIGSTTTDSGRVSAEAVEAGSERSSQLFRRIRAINPRFGE